MNDERHPQRRPAGRRIATVAAAAVVLALVGYGVFRLATAPVSAPRKTVPDVVQLKLIQPPPPPPPPPPPKQKMVEQDRARAPEIRNEKPQETPPSPKQDATPPGPPALDAKGEGPGDSFGLQGRPGGGDFLGGGGGGGGSRFGWFSALVEGHAQEALRKRKGLETANYRIGVEIWFDDSGAPQRVELVGSTGDAELDRTLRETLLGMSRLSEPPPKDLPQPVVMRVTSS